METEWGHQPFSMQLTIMTNQIVVHACWQQQLHYMYVGKYTITTTLHLVITFHTGTINFGHCRAVGTKWEGEQNKAKCNRFQSPHTFTSTFVLFMDHP